MVIGSMVAVSKVTISMVKVTADVSKAPCAVLIIRVKVKELDSCIVLLILPLTRCRRTIIGTLRSDNGNVHESVTEKIDSASFQPISRFSQVGLLLKRREFMLELNRGDRTPVQTEIVELIALAFPSSKKLKIWSFHVLVV